MGDNNVASIGKMLMQTQSGQSVTGVDGADIGTTFRKMVDQMTQIPGSSVSTGSQTAQNMQQLTPHSPEQNYDRYQYQKNKIPEQSTKDWTAGSQVSEKLESFEESVRDVIKDELQVTDEQITEAMETLGLTVADLMNPQQLAALAAELTGTEDMSALLCNEAFMNVMQSVGTLTEDLLQELGVTAEELTQLLEDAGQADMNADLMQTVQTADAADARRVYADTADGIRDTAEQPQIISLTQLAAVAGCSRDYITQLYLHWTAGRYGQVYDDYHLNIDADGTVYRTSSSLSQYKSHTWRRNSGSIAVALCCGLGAQANHGYDADLGQFAPTAVQTDKMAQTVALLVTALGLQLTIDTVMTHCEAALLDGYGPYSGDAETRWDLWYMRDSPGDGQMKPGGDILRGKARWYLEHSKI